MATKTVRRVKCGAVLVIIFGFGVAACGGGGTKSSSATTTAATNAPTTAATTAPATATGSGTDPGSSFCQDAKALQAKAAQEVQSEITGTPVQVKALFQQTLSELPVFVSKAPSQIKSAVEMVASVDQQLYGLLQAAGFSYTKLATNPAATSLLQTPSFNQANVTINSYLSKVCGISSSTPPTT